MFCEPQAIISDCNVFASATASADLPDAVGPTTTIKGKLSNSIVFMEKKCAARETTAPAAQETRAPGCPRFVVATVSLIRGFDWQIVQEVKAQFDIRPAERRRQRLKRVRRSD